MYKELLNYQEIDADLRKIEVEISGSEARQKALSAKKFLDGVNDSLAQMEKRSEELLNMFTDLNKMNDSFKENLNDIESGVSGAESEAEVNFLLKKSDELNKKVQALEGKINKLYEEIQGLFTSYNSLKKKTAAAKAQYAEFGQKYKELKDEKKPQMDEIEGKLKEIEKKVDPDLMAKYKLKRKDKMFPILYKLQSQNCGHCLMELSMAEVEKLNNGCIIECDNCHCLIYKE